MSKAPRNSGGGTPVLSVRGVTRTYQSAAGPLTVLKGVDLDVMPDGPIRPTTSPGRTSRSTPLSTVRGPAADW